MSDRKLEIGGRQKLGPEWTLLNVEDGPEVDVVADAAVRLPFDDEAFYLVYASHVLEHIAWQRTVPTLREWRRVLAPEGVLEVWVPDLAKIVGAYVSGVIPDGWRRSNPEADPTVWALGRLFGVGGSPRNWHRSAFDAGHLMACLAAAGFSRLRELDGPPRGLDHGYVNLGVRAVK